VPAGAGVGAAVAVGFAVGEGEAVELAPDACAIVTAFSELENDPVAAIETNSPT
jgi:hypothetical protein